MIEVYFDGLCQPVNPGGIACYAFVVKNQGKTIHNSYGIAGEPFSKDSTNNVAEYTALIKALEWLAASEFDSDAVRVIGDSKLVISQLGGQYKVRSKRILPLYRRARELKESFKNLKFLLVPREENKEADGLTNRAYREALEDNPSFRKRI
ncbi:MAG TPA: ribonuclease HI [Nitrososphaera sp.]